MKDIPVSTVYLLKQTELAVRGCAEVAFATVDLTPSQYFILVHVKLGFATSAAELARAMGVLPQSMTEFVAPLELRGAIARRPDPTNNRILRIRLTAAGERLLAKGTEVALELERELVEDFDAGALMRFNDALARLRDKAEAHTLHPKSRRASGPAPGARARGAGKTTSVRRRRAEK